MPGIFFGPAAAYFGSLTRKERIAMALQQGMRLHPELGQDSINPLSKAMTIAWQNMPFQAGGWFTYSKDQRKNEYETMLKGQKERFFMAGDAMSYVPGWMEGAIGSGRIATCNILEQVEKKQG